MTCLFTHFQLLTGDEYIFKIRFHPAMVILDYLQFQLQEPEFQSSIRTELNLGIHSGDDNQPSHPQPPRNGVGGMDGWVVIPLFPFESTHVARL